MCSLSSKKKDITECLLAEYYASAKMHLYLDLIFLKEEGKVPASASIFTRFCIAVQGVPYRKCFSKLAKHFPNGFGLKKNGSILEFPKRIRIVNGRIRIPFFQTIQDIRITDSWIFT